MSLQAIWFFKFNWFCGPWKLLTVCAHQSASSCQNGLFKAQAAMVIMQTDINLEQAHMTAVETQLQSSNADLQNMKCMVQNMAERIQAMQSMMMSPSLSKCDGFRYGRREEAQKAVKGFHKLNQLILMVPAIVPAAISLRSCTRRNKPK